MTHDPAKSEDRALDAFFEAARHDVTAASPDLLARVLDDAYAAQDQMQTAPEQADPIPTPVRQEKWGAAVWKALGGWPAFAGLAAATMAGVWIGYSPPLALDTLSLTLMDSGYGLTPDGALPDYDLLLADG